MAKYTKETDVLFQYSQGFRLIVPNAYKTCHTQFYSVDYPNGLAIAPSSYIVEGGKTYCPVPNQMTVKPNSIIVFAYLLEESRAITESKTVLEVWERPKPPDFIFEPTDTITYATAAEMIEQMKGSLEAEKARVEAESLRATAEESRVAAEESREAAESSRVTAEASRVTAEAERESAESDREIAEASRESAESERQTAEALRVSAESSRASAEEARVTAETTRASAEESRAAAESARASAEESRESAESSRVIVESERASAESSRESAESERQASESARESAEETRQANESARISAEASRASAESSRVSAEASRVSAEALRETKWNNASATAVTGDVNADVVITDSGVVFNFAIPRGPQGDKGDPGDKGNPGNTGNGISSMTLVSGNHAAGTVDTYRLTFTDGTYQDFTVYNGANGDGAGDMLWEEFNNRFNPSGKNGQIAFESDLTAHTGNTDIHVTTDDKTAWNAKYNKPSSGIPKSDLASAVQVSLGKADSALQEHQDISGKANVPTFSQYTILTSGWSSGVYSFESAFPSATYDIEIELDSTATSEQLDAWSSAKPTAVFGTNTMKALGDVPTVDIPVIVKKVMK